MKVPMQWIREYADIPADAARYTERMVMTGTGVEGVEVLGEGTQLDGAIDGNRDAQRRQRAEGQRQTRRNFHA